MQQLNKEKAWSFSAVFCAAVLIHILVEIFASIIGSKYEIPIFMQLILSEMTIILPGLTWIVLNKASFRETLKFKPIKVSTIFMSILLIELLSPLVTLINLLSQLYEGNAVVDMSVSAIGENKLLLLFIMGFFGPFVEEFVFRGIIANGMNRFSSALGAAVVSGLMFGLLHMNFNQFCYAFVLGIIFHIVNYASGSVYTSMVMHTVVNTQNVLLLFISEKFMSAMGSDIASAASDARTSDMFYYMIGIYLILAVIFTAVSLPVFSFIAKNEGNPDAFRHLKDKRVIDESVDDLDETATKKVPKSWWLNAYSIIGAVICLLMIFALEPILKALGLM